MSVSKSFACLVFGVAAIVFGVNSAFLPEVNADCSSLFGDEVLYEAGSFPISVAIGDLDGDGDADLAAANWDSGNVSVLLNQCRVVCEGDANGDGLVDPLDGGFVLARFGCPVGTGDPGCDTADMNGDGLVDPLDVGFVLARFGTCQ